MALLLSAKGSDILAWRAAGESAVTLRQVLLDRMEFCRSDEASALLNGVVDAINGLAASNDTFCDNCDRLLEEVAACREIGRLKELTATYYSGLYDHVALHSSAPAFYQFSTLFLQALAGAVGRFAHAKLGLSPPQLPEMALIALGPAGRQEFSPYCPLQLMLVNEYSVDNEVVAKVAAHMHEGFEACGLKIDAAITPRNPEWRGSMTEWGERLDRVLKQGRSSEIIEILRLADQNHLAGAGDTGSRFRQLSQATLTASPIAANNMVSWVVGLSNGIGIMGGLRYEKKGPHRGCFALLDNGLQPLSASLSVLGLIKQLDTTATPRRIRELLWRRELNVDLAERLLQAWHMLHELRLKREREVQPDWSDTSPLYLKIEDLDAGEQEALRESLEAISHVQRYIGLNFSGLGE